MSIQALTRKQLPEFGVVEGLTVDIPSLATFCHEKGYLDPKQYIDGQRHDASVLKEYWSAHDDKFVNEILACNQYRQLALSKYNGVQRTEGSFVPKTQRSRLKRIYKNSKEYVAEADEHNFGVLTEKVEGPIKDVLDKFKSPFGRVRFAMLAPRFKVDPHIDHDPSYLTRYHIPIVTNEHCWMGVERNGTSRKVNFKADGRVYFLNTGFKHWIENNSDEWRLHLIIDAQNQADLETLVAL